MQVVAFSTPSRPEWRWRIVNYAGEVIEESRTSFPTIERAVSAGGARLAELNVVDRSSRPTPYGRSTSFLRSR
jgi:hypothetical protein